MYKFAAAIAVLFSLYGCATPVDPQKVDLFDKTIPACVAGPDCDLKWAAARTFVVINSKMRFQHVTNDYMETFSPPESEVYLGFRVNKEPAGKDVYQIRVAAWCSNPYVCVPNAIDAMISFNNYVNNTK